ncbi:Putative O-methyltransferase MSMEG_5073 [Nocardia africana]|uniref:O-methyltransferase MSMEG_5073 n=2 Tax=Nocardia africana TaxID=134964 RepID=A0A378WTE9_9NOCA|nr:Putative O-methyltransferase MSMEG_5073 [Nocardia africana]
MDGAALRLCGRGGTLADMTNAGWGEVDRYVVDTLIGDADSDVAQANSDAGLPPIDVSPAQGKFLYLLALSAGARRLEIGTLGGFSTLWLARAVGPQGRVVTLEYDPHQAEVARANLDRKGVGERVEIRVGAALDTLPGVAEDHGEPFDLVFIDADKVNNANYVQWALRLTRPGSVIIVDNVVRRGALADGDPGDPAVRGAREALRLLADEPRLEATVLQTVGSKGWDGFAYAVVTG